MDVKKIAHKVICFLTPIKFAAWSIMILAFFTRLSNPFFHYIGGPNSTAPTPIPEAIFKAVFIFCSAFALLGNGKTIRLRLSMVLIPYYYLALTFIIKFIQTGTQSLVLPMLLLVLISIWISAAGEYYEFTDRKCPNFVDSYINWLATKFDFKTNRQNKG